MPALASDLDLRPPLQRLVQDGAAYLPDALTEPFRRRLHDEIVAGAFESLPAQMGPYQVRTEADLFEVSDNISAYPAVIALRDEVIELIHRHGREITGLERWHPNDIAVQRYFPGTHGISPHLDGKKYGYLVAIFTITGTAPFALCSDRSGTIVEEWHVTPGSLTLLRGPGLAGAEDARPLHKVEGPIDEVRFSVSFRMNTRPDHNRR